MKLLYLLISLLVQYTLAVPLGERGLPLKPSQDDFYQPPAGYESQKVGTILKHRLSSYTFGVVVIPEKIKEVHQFLVRSEDSLGQPNAIVTTLFVPYNADPTKLLSYQSAEDSASFDCAPSYAMALGSSPATILTAQIEELLAQAGLNEGWYVVIPDHEGPKSTFVVGRQAGQAVLNSVRAVLQSGNVTGINNKANVAFWGYSGGSLGSSWGAFLHPTYAPEIKLVGSAFGGIIADIDSIARFNLGKLTAGFVFTAINGLANEYDFFNDFVKSIIPADKYQYFTTPLRTCLIEYIPLFLFKRLEDFNSQGIHLLDNPIVRKVTDLNNSIKQNFKPTAPLFMYNSKFDEIVPAGDADKLYDNLCGNGATVLYRQSLFGGHGTQAVTGAGNAFSWLKDRLNGKPASQGCQKQNTLSNALNAAGLAGLSDVIINGILTILQKPVGPYSWII